MSLRGAALLMGLLVLTWYAAYHVGFVQRADASILRGFGGLGQRPRLGTLASFIAHLCDPNPYVYFCAIPVATALARRRVRVAVAIGAILLGANVTSQLLKPLLAQPRGALFPYGPSLGSWPSGHATAAMALALCCVLAAPARVRPIVASLGAAFAVAVSYSFLSLKWHFPSDVLGGFLVAGIWTLLGAAAVLVSDGRRSTDSAIEPSRRATLGEALGPPSAALLGAIALAGLVLIARPHQVVSYAHLHKTFVIGAAGIGALGLALATGVMLTLRR